MTVKKPNSHWLVAVSAGGPEPLDYADSTATSCVRNCRFAASNSSSEYESYDDGSIT